jgi:signal transduction histidine kinase
MSPPIDSDPRLRELSQGLQASNRSLSVALAAAEDMAAHAMNLQEVTAALSQAQTEEEVANVVLGKGLDVVGSVRGILARVAGERLEIIHANGYQPEMRERILQLTFANESPLTHAVRTGQPLWLGSPDEHLARFPLLYQHLGIAATQASVAVPLHHSGQIVGALAMFFADSSGFSAVKRAFTLLLAQAAADALVRARNYDAERVARLGAETLAQARADVLGIVAHDLRNPLGLIASSSSLLLEIDELPPSQRRKTLEIVQRAARRMNRLIADLLDATRLQAGRLSLDLADIDVAKIVRETEETFAPSAAQQGIELRSHAPQHVCCVRADEGRLLQVVGNLVGNALKFTTQGGHVTVSARCGGTDVILSVADNGPGIPCDAQTHLFESFWQARTGDRRGVGLGLSITKDIITAHGGRLWVDSTVGVGSTFSFELPSATHRAQVNESPTEVSA